MGDKSTQLSYNLGGGVHERSRVSVIILVCARAAPKERLALSRQAIRDGFVN